MEPVDALERIVYLMDRQLAPAQKVRAFANAADVIRAMDPAEVERLSKTGRITELDGIGASTGGVINEAVAGKVPARLTKLEAESVIPIGEGAALREALRGDCHSHSLWSDGGAPIETMARTARDELGHEYLVLTDHSPRLTIAHGLSPERLREQLAEVDALNTAFAEEAEAGDAEPFQILTGMEVDILEDGALDMDDDMLERLDVVVASVHSKLSMERQYMTQRMVMAVANPHVDILGHCTGRKVVGKGRKPSTFDAEIVFAACAQFETAVEINCRPERQDPPDDLLELALEYGCKVSIDTDAHAPGQLEWQSYGCDKAARHGIEVDEIVNTRPADDLIAWAAGHAAG
jgi:putative hydrolase